MYHVHLRYAGDNDELYFRDYLNEFSENVTDILERMNFDDQVENLDKNGALYQVVCDFNAAKAYLGPDEVATNDNVI